MPWAPVLGKSDGGEGIKSPFTVSEQRCDMIRKELEPMKKPGEHIIKDARYGKTHF